jgi:phage gpG-like protein
MAEVKFNDGQVGAALSRAGEDAIDLRRVADKLEGRFHDGNREQFDSQGARSGGWEQLSEAYAPRSARPLREKVIERKTGRLYESLTGDTADSIRVVEKEAAEFGTSLPYALDQQEGDPRGTYPARPLIVVTDEDVDFYAQAVLDDAAEFMHSLGFEIEK